MSTEALESHAPHQRRVRRSAYLPNAVRFQLEHVCRVLELGAIVLADDLGIPIAQAGDPRLAELLADSSLWTDRHGPAVDPMAWDEIRRRFPRYRNHEVASKVLVIPGPAQYWRLTAIGKSCVRYIGIEHAAAGVERILREAASVRSEEPELRLEA